MGVDIDRLKREAADGDLDALKAFLREEIRRGNVQKVRDLARVTIYNGRGFTLQFKDGRRIHGLEGSCPLLPALATGPITLIEPVEVPLLWSAGRERLFVADCVEHVLPVFECFYGLDPVPLLAGIEGARQFARGEIESEELREVRASASILTACIAIRGHPLRGARAIIEAVMKLCCDFEDSIWTSKYLDRVLIAVRDVEPDVTAARKWQGSLLLQYLLGQLDPELRR